MEEPNDASNLIAGDVRDDAAQPQGMVRRRELAYRSYSVSMRFNARHPGGGARSDYQNVDTSLRE
jgi:hypothetical protein